MPVGVCLLQRAVAIRLSHEFRRPNLAPPRASCTARAAGTNISEASVRAAITRPHFLMGDCFMSCSFHTNAERKPLEFDFQLQIGAILAKIREVQRARIVDRVASDLSE